MAYYTIAAVILAILSAGVGAFGGRWLMLRDVGPVLRNAAASSQRANAASTVIDNIAAEWPAVLEHVQALEGTSRKAALNAQEAKRMAGDTVARQDALEQSIAGALNVTLTRGR